jgi:hypothetical protein
MSAGIAVAPIVTGNMGRDLSVIQTSRENLKERMIEENRNKVNGVPAADKVVPLKLPVPPGLGDERPYGFPLFSELLVRSRNVN